MPLNDLGSGSYLGFTGGLYPNGMNQMPSDHLAAGLIAASSVRPLNSQGQPASNGKIALLSVGMSNTTQEFCSDRSGNQPVPCTSISFVGQATADPAVNHSTLVFINGASGGQAATTWDSPSKLNYDRVRDFDLAQAGLTEAQVQVAWLKVANPNPTVSLPASNADANILLSGMGNIVRAMKIRYPNLRIVYVSSRIYAGYASSTLNPEPYSYESAFSVKWLIEAQINQMRGASPDPISGNLSYNTVAPLLAWGPYPWANGMTPRSDGLVWQCSDLNSDGTHPANPGRQKVGTMLLNFLKNEETARSWFLADGVTATKVSISGRILTSDGRGLRNAIVTLTDQGGVRRTATTSSFGFYGFYEVPSGMNYTVGVSSKRYRFAARVVDLSSDLTDINFVGLE